MVKIIEAQALITAKDATGQAFASVAKNLEATSKAAQVVSRANIRQLSEMSRKFGEFTKATSTHLDQLGRKDQAIDNLTRSMKRMAETRTAFRDAEANVRSLGREMNAAGEPSRRLARDYEAAQRQVRNASAAFSDSSRAAIAAKRAVSDLGMPLVGLGRQQAEIREKITATTRALRQQARVVSNFRTPLTKLPGASPIMSHPPAPRHPVGLPEAVAGVGIWQTVQDTMLSGMNVDTERSQARQAGWTDKEIETLEHRANRFAAQYGVAPATAMNIIREARPTFGGDLQQTLQNVPDFFKVLTAMRQKSPQASEGEHGYQLGMLIKAGEILGYSSEPKKLREYADFMTQMVQVHGSALRGEEILNFAKSSKSAGSAASFDFLKSVMPTMLPELGGDRLGTALMTLRQALVGGKMKKRAAEAMTEYGLIDPAGVIATKDEDVKGVRQDAVKGWKIAEKNPLEWVRDFAIPAMDEKGVKPEERSAIISTFFSDRNAEYIINLMMTQMARLEKDRATVEKAKGLPGVDQALKDDPYLAVNRVKGSLKNVGAAISDPAIEPLKKAADAAAENLNSAAEAARGNKTATGAGVAGGAIAGGALATYLTQGAGVLLRLGSMAVGVGGGAVAGGLAVPLLIQKALESDERMKNRAETYFKVGPDVFERSRLAQDAFRRDPEAARGRAMMDLQRRSETAVEPVVKPDQVTAKLEGQALVGVNVTVEPTPDFIVKIVKAVLSQVGHIAVDASGPGSTGRSMTEAAAPETGRQMGPR
ncbi:hypothetical protein [Bosea sp. TND4EK4]|uniref:hypothetical protein n=1 Tax=Bosea sp. TND4EK4 TaxID=1907408 RepID=UPI0009567095|nr:hypothetical protein [Bosea sp. TND4EK4]SIQ59806.1 hypothetical protein SAMN05880592_10484 [Bosea sp. TND4EK4]